MRNIILLLLLLAAPALYAAETYKTEIYKWVDEKGNVGYADDLGKVPQKYRSNAFISEKVEQAVEVIEKIEPEKSVPKGGTNKSNVLDNKEKNKTELLFDGKSGEAWKQDFARQKHEIKSLEDQAIGLKERMAEGNKVSRSDYLSLQATMRDLDIRIAKSQKKLDALGKAADSAELPGEFR